MPPRYAFRLEDLRVFHLVRASCHACGHKAIIPNATLLQGRPGYTRLMSLERQLRCRKCGARGKASLDRGISAAGLRTGGQFEFRQLIYSAEYGAMTELLGYLTENCCGRGESCVPACNPADAFATGESDEAPARARVC